MRRVPALAARLRAAVRISRADDWWDPKLSPMLGTGYATALLLHLSLMSLWPTLLLTLLAAVAAATYVSLINDLTDLGVDRAAGKPNRLEAQPRAFPLLAIAGCVAVGALLGLLAWHGDVLAWAVYGGAWLAFSFYSIPPLRLKARGLPGALADAAGAHVGPQLLVVAVVSSRRAGALDLTWLALVGIWAFAYGMRGAVWHQLNDAPADATTHVRTFGASHPVLARRLVTCVLFPIELIALGTILWRVHSALALALLPIGLLLDLLRVRIWRLKLRIVTWGPMSRLAVHEYYVVFYPIGFLLAATLRDPAVAIILVAHAVLFRRSFIAMARDARSLTAQLVRTRLASLRATPTA
jgi:4-hydroxybenzoate polyprenyltransferase